MRRKQQKQIQEKICSLLDQVCLGSGCQLYNPVVNNCEISVLSYNLYKLWNVEEQRVNGDFESDDRKPVLPALR